MTEAPTQLPVALHLSSLVHAEPSLHGVPDGSGVRTHKPVAGTHLFFLQGVSPAGSHVMAEPEGTEQNPPMHLGMPLHLSPSSLHAESSLHWHVPFQVNWQPLSGSQVSVVHVLLSLQVSGLLPTHFPAVHLSVWVQTEPSLQGAVLLAKTHSPLAGLHESSVQGLLSRQTLGGPDWHLPATQMSPAVHLLPSSQLLGWRSDTGGYTHPLVGSQRSSVHTLLSVQVRGEPAHLSLTQMSPVVQASPSLQAFPGWGV
jgi:hypothetical protein